MMPIDPLINEDDASFAPCVQARQLGQTLLVKSLARGRNDFYLLPFYKDHAVCAIAVVDVDHNAAHVSAFSVGDMGEKYPAIDAQEAVRRVSEETGKGVKEGPVLVYISVREYPNSISNPSWQVKTVDGETYYVIFSTGPVEEGGIKTRVSILNAAEVHEIN